MQDEEAGRVPRLMVFPDRPDCLVLYLPIGMDLRLPPIASPFSKHDVGLACAQAGLDVRVSEGTPGKWGAAYRSLHHAEAAERNQRNYLATAAANADRRGSGSMAAASRAEAIEAKAKVDEEIRALKAEIGKAKSDAFAKGKYLPVEIFRNKEKRLKDLRDESQALQVKIGELKQKEKAERAVEIGDGSGRQKHLDRKRSRAELFMTIAHDVLSEDALQRIYGLMQEDEEVDDGDYGKVVRDSANHG